MSFKLFGTEIYVSFLFMALITVLLATDKTGFMLPALFAVSVHETGHLFAMWLCECNPKRIKLIPTSVQISSSFTKKYKNDIAVALCGPAVNIVLFFTLYVNFIAFKNQITLCYALINLVIGIFNLLPFAGLDGGTVLYSLLVLKSSPEKARLVMKIIGILSAACLIAFAVVLTVKHKVNISLYLMGIYLIIVSLLKI